MAAGALDPLGAFLALRDEAHDHSLGEGGRETCLALANSLDGALAQLATDVAGVGLAVVAVGGFGRQEQCLHSDVDVMILHARGDVADAVQAVLYPLWDSNVKIGHSVRTVTEAVQAARERFETLTSLLTMRTLAGDPGLVDTLHAKLADVLRSTPLDGWLTAAERQRRVETPFPVSTADLKTGRGGLRALHGFVWQRRRHELLGLGVPHVLSAEETGAYDDLLAVRNALHAASGRQSDVLDPDLRQSAARWLAVDEFELAAKATAAMKTVDQLVLSRFPDVLSPAAATARPRPLGDRFKRKAVSEPLAAEIDVMATAVDAAVAHHGLDLTAAEREALSDVGTWGDAHRSALAKLLAGGVASHPIWDALDITGWIDVHVPEWGVVRALPQLARFHEHPVDVHLWRTVYEMNLIIGGDKHREIVEQAGPPELLRLAALLHDIGKGHGGNHSIVGEEIATDVLTRLGYDATTIELVAKSVRLHLLLAETATRRDISDPQVLASVGEATGSEQLLALLYVLTIADSCATGKGMWTPWKATLLRSLFVRVSQWLGEASVGSDLVQQVLDVVDDTDRTAVEAYLDAMSPDYLVSTQPQDIAWHLELTRSLPDIASVSVQPGDVVDEIVVVGRDRTGFLGSVAKVFAAHGISILGARLFTRNDGTAIDSFTVTDDRAAASIASNRWPLVERDLIAELVGELDVTERIEQRRRDYRHRFIADHPVRVGSPTATQASTVLEVHCADRIGRLADIVDALYSVGLDITLAKLDTRGSEVVDTFYVQSDGQPVGDDALAGIVDVVKAALE